MNDTIVTRAEAAHRAGNPIELIELVRGSPADHPRLRYLEVWALAQLGENDLALEKYLAYGLEDGADEDGLALKGRLFKDRSRHAAGDERRGLLRAASGAYTAAYRRSGGYFSAINAATTAFMCGDETTARTLARDVLAHAELTPPRTYYAAATRAEALLLIGHTEEAIAALEHASHLPGADVGNRASTTRQMRWLAPELGLTGAMEHALAAAVRIAPVITYCGHRFAQGSPGEAALAGEIARTLNARGATIAYGSLACGADILFAEALLALGGELHIVLPFDEADFLAVSVIPGGENWRERYERCIAGARSVTYASRMCAVDDDEQFFYGSQLIMGLARLRASQLETEALQIAIWDGAPAHAGAGAGTAIDIALWRRGGGETVTLRGDGLDRAMSPYRRPRRSDRRRVLRAILFADFAGFSRLSETALPNFLSLVFGRVAAVLDAYGASVVCRNSWGDAVFAIVDRPQIAAEIALAIQSSLRGPDLVGAGLPEDGGMRISLHHGPIYADHDPVRGAATFYGTEITLAARIEPRVPIGAIYATQSFAALLMTEEQDRAVFSFVGSIDLAKGYGRRPIYRLIDYRGGPRP